MPFRYYICDTRAIRKLKSFIQSVDVDVYVSGFFYSHCTLHFLNSFQWVRELLLNTKHNDQGTACGNRKWKQKCQIRIETWNGKIERWKKMYTHINKTPIQQAISMDNAWTRDEGSLNLNDGSRVLFSYSMSSQKVTNCITNKHVRYFDSHL